MGCSDCRAPPPAFLFPKPTMSKSRSNTVGRNPLYRPAVPLRRWSRPAIRSAVSNEPASPCQSPLCSASQWRTTLVCRPKARSAVSTDPVLPGQPRFCSLFRRLHIEPCSPCRTRNPKAGTWWSTPSGPHRVAASRSPDFEGRRSLRAAHPAVNRVFQLNRSGNKKPRNKAARLGFGAVHYADLEHPSETEGSA